MGSQNGPLFSLDTYRRFLLPGQKKIADLARFFGVRVMYHNDGAAEVLLPHLIDEEGIDILNPIQWFSISFLHLREGLAWISPTQAFSRRSSLSISASVSQSG